MKVSEFLFYLKFENRCRAFKVASWGVLMSLQKVRISCQHPAENLQIKLLMCLTQTPIFSTTSILSYDEHNYSQRLG